MEPSIDEVLAYEVKKEMADRYFGFRKLIEDDKLDLSEKIKLHSVILEKRICFELVRIYNILKNDALIQEFIELTGWHERLYYDPYLTESPTLRARVFAGIRLRGLTRATRFKNLLLDCYERLVDHVQEYRQSLEELQVSREAIHEEIKIFYRRNDIGNIMGFLRSLDAHASETLPTGVEAGLMEGFDEKMRVEPPEPVERQLPVIPPLVPLPNIRKKLRRLIDKAYKVHGETFLDTLPK